MSVNGQALGLKLLSLYKCRWLEMTLLPPNTPTSCSGERSTVKLSTTPSEYQEPTADAITVNRLEPGQANASKSPVIADA